MQADFVSAVEAIYAAAVQPEAWPQTLQAIADCFDDVGAVLIWSRDDGSVGSISSPSLAKAQQDYQEGGWSQRDIRFQRAAQRMIWQRGGTACDRDVLSPEEMASDPFYTGFLAAHGLNGCLAVGISPSPHISVAISVQRLAGRALHTADEADLLARLGRHAENSLRLSIRLLDAELLSLSLAEALGRLNVGVFAVDARNRVVFLNSTGRTLLGNGLAMVGGRLVPSSATAHEALLRAVKRFAGDAEFEESAAPILVPRANTDRPLAIYAIPVAARDSMVTQFLSQARAILLVVDLSREAVADPSVVRDVFGLTLGEARLAALVGVGIPPRDAASKLGITEETARSVLKRVFAKVGVSRQSELATLMTRLALQ